MWLQRLEPVTYLKQVLAARRDRYDLVRDIGGLDTHHPKIPVRAHIAQAGRLLHPRIPNDCRTAAPLSNSD